MLRQRRSCGALAPYVTLAVVLGAGARALAFEADDLLAISAGPFVLHPHLQVAEQYDDNVFFQVNKTEDFLTILTPGFDLRTSKPEADYNFGLSYNYSQIWYAENPLYNAMDQTVALNGSYKGARVRIEGNVSVQYLNSIYGGLEAFLGGYYGVVQQNLDRQGYLIPQPYFLCTLRSKLCAQCG